jgi:hypothetical protein
MLNPLVDGIPTRVERHSVRVGATHDLLVLNIDLGSVMQAGCWTSDRMPMRYGGHVLAARGGMARAAEQQGRDQRISNCGMTRLEKCQVRIGVREGT